MYKNQLDNCFTLLRGTSVSKHNIFKSYYKDLLIKRQSKEQLDILSMFLAIRIHGMTYIYNNEITE